MKAFLKINPFNRFRIRHSAELSRSHTKQSRSIKISLLIILIVFTLFKLGEIKAGTEHNVSGWAWSDNIGWISFNSTTPDPDDAYNYGVNVDGLTGIFSGYAWSDNIGWIDFSPPGFYPVFPDYSACLDFPGPGQVCDGVGDYKVSGWAKVLNPGNGWDGWINLRYLIPPCPPPGGCIIPPAPDYGVFQNPLTDELEGWAWSDDFGWISFNSLNCDPDGDGFSNGIGGCPSAGTPIPNYGVKMKPNNPPELQWLGTGNYTSDGLDPETGDTTTLFDYRVEYSDSDGDAPNFVRVHIEKGGLEFASSPFGMIYVSGDYINGAIYSYSTTSLPIGSDYTYFFEAQDSMGEDVALPIPPTEIDAPDVNNPPNKPQNPDETMSSCSWGIPQVNTYTSIILSWTYSDLEGDPQTAYEVWVDHTSSFIDPKFNVVVDPGASDSYALNLNDDPGWLSELDWNTTYYWKVRVKDSQNWSEEWSDTDSFTMKTHANPYPGFIPFPSSPAVDEVVEFIQDNPGVAQALCYNGGEHACEGDINAAYEWDFDYNSGVDSTFKGNASTTYDSMGNYTVRLRITDIVLNSCYIDKTVNIGVPLPEWKEIPPY